MSNIEVLEKFWRSAKFTVNIVRIPNEKIDDKLAVISNGNGTLSFSKFDQFLLDNCVVDANKVFKFLDSLEDEAELMIEAAIELRHIILEVNPLLDPELLIFNDENVIKIAQQTDKPQTTRRLVDNPNWDKPEFDTPQQDEIEDFIRSMPSPVMPFSRGGASCNPDQMVPHHWEETELLIVVLEYDPNEIPEIFKDNASFDNEEIYSQFVITRCVHDYSNLFVLLDRMGFTKKFGPPALTKMLYDISVQHNPFLSWEEIDLDKVKRVVDRKFGKRGPVHNAFKKRGPDEVPLPDGAYRDFIELPEEEITSLPDRVKNFVVGQDEVVDVVCEAVQLASVGLKEVESPIGVFLLTGDTGTGKTFTSKMFAQELCGDEHAIVRVDCSEYSQKHEVSKLIGSPNGYVGFEEGGYLTNALIKRPFTVVLFDEIEKAHSSLHNLLLQIMDEGRLTSNKGETVSFGETLIFLTSNIGVQEVENIGRTIGVGDVSVVTKERQEGAIAEGLKARFKPEFLNRLDSVLTFNSLSRENGLRIIDLAFDRVNGWLKDRNIEVTFTKRAAEYIYDVGFKPGFGARPLKRAMRKEVMLPISRLMLKDKIKGDCTIRIGLKGKELIFDAKKKAAVKGQVA